MTAEPIVIVGAGGFGRNVMDAVTAVNEAADRPVFDVIGVLDDAPSVENLAKVRRRGASFLGQIDEWLADAPAVRYVSGLGSPSTRQAVAKKFALRDLHSVSVIHPAAGVSAHVSIAEGAVILGGVQVLADAVVGRHVHLNANAMIGHDAVLDEFVSVNPGGAVSGNCHVHRGAMIGAGAVILQGLIVGSGATVGAAACVVNDVPDGATVVGIPARTLKNS